jgi:hypothetical protein
MFHDGGLLLVQEPKWDLIRLRDGGTASSFLSLGDCQLAGRGGNIQYILLSSVVLWLTNI